MPRGDGTGPLGQGPGTGRRRGMGRGRGKMGGGRIGVGSTGNCVCPSCGVIVAHQAGIPCASMDCPKCGMRMVRE
ncbi:MAG: hypothetical protein PHS93_02550 [Candidatus Omnitrophica bacterium]|nr:hypothetical protein [Candidatus Omnitrophota bacterium]MDD5352029.1 hypothetical protein [Candidatus Omnitrophota bacterium]